MHMDSSLVQTYVHSLSQQTVNYNNKWQACWTSGQSHWRTGQDWSMYIYVHTERTCTYVHVYISSTTSMCVCILMVITYLQTYVPIIFFRDIQKCAFNFTNGQLRDFSWRPLTVSVNCTVCCSQWWGLCKVAIHVTSVWLSFYSLYRVGGADGSGIY